MNDRAFKAQFREYAHRLRDDPDLFNTTFLRKPKFWWRQVELGRSLARYGTTLAISGNSVGKDYFTGTAIPWWLCTRPNSLVVVTGPSQTVLGTVTWKEVRRAVNGKGSLLRDEARVTSGAKASPLQVDFGNDWQALGYSTTSVERASGQHNVDLFVIVEEASGIEDEVLEAIRGLNPAKMLWIGNPLRAEGPFYNLYKRALREKDDHTIPDSRRINVVQIPSTDSPDIHLERSPRGLADKGFIEEAERDYGRGSLWWTCHVDANFPDGDGMGRLLPDAWLDRLPAVVAECERLRASDRFVPRRRIGVDLGEGTGRDRTVLVVADQLGILHVEASDRIGIPEAAVKIDELARKYGVRQDRIVYDAGGRGKDLPRYLEHHSITDAFAYRGSRTGGDRFANLRSRVAWRLRQRLDPERPEPKAPPAPPPDHKPSPFDPLPAPSVASIQPPFSIPAGSPWWTSLREELAALKYEMKGARIALEPKDEMSQRLGRSPDFADALLMTFAVGD